MVLVIDITLSFTDYLSAFLIISKLPDVLTVPLSLTLTGVMPTPKHNKHESFMNAEVCDLTDQMFPLPQ